METVFDQEADYWLAKKKIPGDLWKEIEHWTDKGLKALDLGCGGGRIAAGLVPYFSEVYAVDDSPELLRRAAEAHPAVHFVCGDFQQIETWAFMGTKFDVITSNCSIRKDYCDLSAVADLCHAYLNPAGAVILRIQGVHDLQDLIPWELRDKTFYDVDEIKAAFRHFRVVIGFERYDQRFSSMNYLAKMVGRIGLPYYQPTRSLVQRRSYYLVRAMREF